MFGGDLLDALARSPARAACNAGPGIAHQSLNRTRRAAPAARHGSGGL